MISRSFRKRVTYWPKESNDSFGQPVLGKPITLHAHWDIDLSSVAGAEGSSHNRLMVVYLSKPVKIGGRIALNPDGPSYEIQSVGEHPAIKGSETIYVATLL